MTSQTVKKFLQPQPVQLRSGESVQQGKAERSPCPYTAEPGLGQAPEESEQLLNAHPGAPFSSENARTLPQMCFQALE